MNEDFRYIAAIAEHGSISKAARTMHISQPALSQRLKRIEAQMGAELFDRTASPLRPTASGEVVVRYALRAITAEDTMRREVSSVAREQKRRLRIGITMARANTLLAEPIAEFHERYHGCSIELRDLASLEQLHGYFLGGQVDFAVFTPIAPDPKMYDLEVLCRERLVVAVAADLDAPQFAQARNGRVSVRQLEGIPFALPSCGIYFDPIISHLIDSSHVQLDIIVRDCDTPLALSLAQNGPCALIAPSTYLVGRPFLKTYELDDIEAGNVLRYIRRHDSPASLEERRFMEIVRTWLSNQAHL